MKTGKEGGMQRKRHFFTIQELSALLRLYATDVFDPEYIEELSMEKGLNRSLSKSTKTRKGNISGKQSIIK